MKVPTGMPRYTKGLDKNSRKRKQMICRIPSLEKKKKPSQHPERSRRLLRRSAYHFVQSRDAFMNINT